jgi:DNA-binding response OmpR family regulator
VDIANQILQGPAKKKKKRRYALFLVAKEALTSRDTKTLDRVFELFSKDVVVIRLHEPEEGLKVMMLKSIDFIVIDHSLFQDDQTSVEFAQELKKRRKAPVLFVTRDERKLIAAYQEQLPFYEELDDYLTSPVDPGDFSKRFRRMLSGTGRAAKRFEAQVDVKVIRLVDDKEVVGRLIDLSLVGMGLRVSDMPVVRGDQLRIVVQLRDFDYFHPQFGDLLKLAVRVRRVSLDGVTLGCSIEHLTPQQSECIAVLLERLNRRLRAKLLQGRSQAG